MPYRCGDHQYSYCDWSYLWIPTFIPIVASMTFTKSFFHLIGIGRCNQAYMAQEGYLIPHSIIFWHLHMSI
jgi:hypothetical protein